MKVILVINLFLVSFITYGQQGEVSWKKIHEVDALMKSNPKKVMIDLTAEWCGWCKVMDKKTFTDKEVYSYLNEHFYASKVDFDKEPEFTLNGKKYTPKSLARRLGVEGLPTLIFINEDYSVMIPSGGYKKPSQLMDQLQSFAEM